jgi:UDP-glucose 4-epimerase
LGDVRVLCADISDADSVAGARPPRIDAVLHLAGQSSGPRSFSVPLLDVRANILGTLNMIDWCVQNDVDRLLFASTFAVYGDHPERDVLDEDVPCRPRSVYATSKLACEHLLMNYAQPKGVRWNALRMFNVYGPGQEISRPDQGVVGIFMNMLMRGDTAEVRGSLDRFRDLVYIADVVNAWERCLSADDYNKVFNVGTGRRTTFETLIRSLALVMGKGGRLRIEERAGTPGDVKGCIADITRSRRHLGYSPRVTLDDGLVRMWTWASRKYGYA